MPETTAQREDRIRATITGPDSDPLEVDQDAIAEAAERVKRGLAGDELPGMPAPIRPRFEGVEIHTLELTFTGTIKLTCTPGNVAEHTGYSLGDEVELVVTGIVVDRPMGGLKLDDEGQIDWSKTRSRAVIKVHSFDTPDER